LPKLPCACANLRRAARAVTQLYAEEIRRGGLEATQFGLLEALEATGPISQGRLGHGLGMDSTTLTRTLALVRKRGWIEIESGADRRERILRLTPAGRRQLERARPHWQRAQQRLRRALGDGDWQQLQRVLFRVTEAAQHG
jgi:DNA-binding MarR family transcriptional regulator